MGGQRNHSVKTADICVLQLHETYHSALVAHLHSQLPLPTLLKPYPTPVFRQDLDLDRARSIGSRRVKTKNAPETVPDKATPDLRTLAELRQWLLGLHPSSCERILHCCSPNLPQISGLLAKKQTHFILSVNNDVYCN